MFYFVYSCYNNFEAMETVKKLGSIKPIFLYFMAWFER